MREKQKTKEDVFDFYNFERENDYWGGEGVCCCQLKNTSILDFKVSLENYVWIGLQWVDCTADFCFSS